MRLSKRYITATLLLFAAVVSSCAPDLYGGVTYQDDDFYAPHSRAGIKQNKIDKAYAQQQMMESRMQEWANILGIDVDELAQYDNSYNTPYGEKLRSMAGDKYERPASYYEYKYQSALEELSNYDPRYYNADLTRSGQLVISPKYISAIYGVWSPYSYRDFAWSYGYPRWNYNWMWGYPYNPWMGWNYSFGYYNPWWSDYPYYYVPGMGYIYGNDYLYYGYGYSSWYSPFHRPIFITGGGLGGGVGSKKSLIVKQANAYQSPSSSMRRNYDGSTVGRSSLYNPTGSNSQNSFNRSTTYTPSYSTPSRSYSAPSGGYSSPTISTPVRTNSIGR